MDRTAPRAALSLALVLALAACGGDRRAGGAAAGADSTVPAGTQVAPGAQQNAAPHLDTAGLPAIPPEPPITGRDTVRHLGPGQTYASCMDQAKHAGQDERSLLESTCKRLPDAPK